MKKEGDMMRRGILTGLAVAFFLLAGTFVLAHAQDDVQKQPSCRYCGMDREKFGHSRMMIEYDDGTSVGTCSIHCAAVDLALNIDKTPKALKVADNNTKKLVDAEGSFWVIGGNKMGVMTKRAKWAFEKKEDADKFVQENGGSLIPFDEAMKAAYEDMYADTKMIREKRKAMKTKTEGGEHKDHKM
jgi:copper chaperone NosL